MENEKNTARAGDGRMNIKTGPLSVALKAKMPMGCDVFEIVRLVEAEMHGQPLNAKTVYTFTEEVRKRIADLIVVEVDEPHISGVISGGMGGHGGSVKLPGIVTRPAEKKMLYEAIFELNDGKKILGYSDKDEPSVNCGFYHLAATKELKGRVAVLSRDVSSFRFTPL